MQGCFIVEVYTASDHLSCCFCKCLIDVEAREKVWGRYWRCRRELWPMWMLLGFKSCVKRLWMWTGTHPRCGTVVISAVVYDRYTRSECSRPEGLQSASSPPLSPVTVEFAAANFRKSELWFLCWAGSSLLLLIFSVLQLPWFCLMWAFLIKFFFACIFVSNLFYSQIGTLGIFIWRRKVGYKILL